MDGNTGAPRDFTVDGTTFSPLGAIHAADGEKASAELQSEPIQRLAEISSLCNDAKIVYSKVNKLHICAFLH